VRRLAALSAVLALAACGGGGQSGEAGARPALTVSAATSLKQAVTRYGEAFPPARVRLSFGGSDELAAQIRQGVRPDVFAAANSKLPDALFAEGLVEKPVRFAGNRLVLAVPADGERAIGSLEELAGDGVRIAVGARTVPVGAYTRAVLDRLPPQQREAIRANVRTEEPDVGGVVGKLAQGAVDAGFVYTTDLEGQERRLREIALPQRLQPSVAYGAAVVRGTRSRAQAQAFVDGLVSGAGQRALRAAGFLPPP